MRLYYSPGACSLSPHIVACEAGLTVELDKVDFANGRKTEDASTLFEITPGKGYVPALRLDDGSVLSEGVAIIQYLADQAPEKNLMPQSGMQKYRALEWLTFISSEVHKGFSPLYNPTITEDAKKAVVEKLEKRIEYVEGQLAGKQYLLGDAFTLPDAYLYTILRWSTKFAIDLAKHPNVSAFMQRMNERDGVKAALAAEGLEGFV